MLDRVRKSKSSWQEMGIDLSIDTELFTSITWNSHAQMMLGDVSYKKKLGKRVNLLFSSKTIIIPFSDIFTFHLNRHSICRTSGMKNKLPLFLLIKDVIYQISLYFRCLVGKWVFFSFFHFLFYGQPLVGALWLLLKMWEQRTVLWLLICVFSAI